jgi:hypothetical protein
MHENVASWTIGATLVLGLPAVLIASRLIAGLN